MPLAQSKVLVVGALLAAAALTSWPATARDTPEGQASPDLVVTALVMSPEHPGEGDTVTFTATVTNAGDGVAPRYRVGFVLDEQDIGMGLDALGLAPGASAQVVSPQWRAIAGAHHLQAEADHGDVVNEKEESNNRLTIDITVGPAAPRPMPDLVVEALTWAPAEPVEGDKVVLTATVANRGDGAAGGFEVEFRLDDHARGHRHVDGLEAGATLNVEAPPIPALKGEHRVMALADPAGKVAEAREDNNERTATLQVGPAPLPDLVVASLLVEPAPSREGDQLVLRAKLTNHGDAGAGAFRVAFLVDGERIGVADVASLAAGASLEVTSAEWTAQPGEHTATAVADVDEQVAEAREDNNERSRDFTVHEQDRTIAGLTMSVEVCREGRGWLGIDLQVGDHTEPGPCSA